MTQAKKGTKSIRWLAYTVLVLGFLAGGGYFLMRVYRPDEARAQGPQAASDRTGGIRVEVTHPHPGGLQRTTVQPGSVQAFESVELYAGVSGYLKTQGVDIGDRVKRDQVLATVDVPELVKQVQRDQAVLEQTQARVHLMNARVASANADLDAAKAAVVQAESSARSAAATLRFREQCLRRTQELFDLKSIDERLVDERTEQRDAAQEAERAATATIATSKAQVLAATAKIRQAEADVLEAEAEVKVAQAELEKAQVLVQFATIVSPFDGVITQRNFFPWDYIRGANEGGTSRVPLLSVKRTDKLRVVVQVPDREVPYTRPGNEAVVEIDALSGQKFPSRVARVAESEDPDTRLMRVEIDLPNPTGTIRPGMYGRVTIVLEKSESLVVPTSCLVGKELDGQGSVYVVRDGRALRVPVKYGKDDGLRVAILGGLRAEDEVIVQPPSGLANGTPVVAILADAPAQASARH